MIYFEFWVELVLVWNKIPMKMAQNWPFLLQHDTPMPRRRCACLSMELSLGVPESKFTEHSGPPKRSNAPPR